ncbi:MAG: UDP-N-acetylmuramoyl-L-alanyl-D-glutamate--2,6-diaminopimelate ligase [Betaproteobacteria bacterium]
MPTPLAPEVDVPALLARLGATPRRITADSRQVGAGDAFAAYPGEKSDGRAFIADAVARGAGSVLWEALGFRWPAEIGVANLPTENLKAKLGAIADFLCGSPSQDLWVVGVTGTNGKTSCAHWVAQCLDACGRRAGVVGTLGNGLVGTLEPAQNTTPDAAVVHETLARMKAGGAQAVAMEVSSHGLDQGRVNAVAFDVALFTNLTRDHLDYHGTMAAYGAAKARLFAWPALHACVINADDAFGQSLIDTARGRGQKVLSYGFSGADVAATGLATNATGIVLSVATPWGRGDVQTSVVGAFNAQNLLGVLGVLLASDVPQDAALAALAGVRPPPGRMQRFGAVDAPLVVVDYAHSPDALEKVLTALKPALAAGSELVCVFGCGGDRDAGKRPEMGRVVARLADRVIVTSDNPRNEDPATIASAIVRGIRDTGNRRWTVELDRAAAIAAAIGSAKAGDVVLVAGKGHEDYQERNGVREHFSDAEAVAVALAKRSAA